MSHTLHPVRSARLQRSELAVPASSTAFIEKAASSAADYVFLDLEDAVAPSEKEEARKNVIAALHDVDWAARGKTVSVRINGLDTPFMYRDLIDIMEQVGDQVHTFLVPKVGVPADLYCIETIIEQIEQARGYRSRVGTEALIETALGMAHVEAIAASGGRLEALHFGVADYAASMRARTVSIGGLNPDYPGDQWHFALSRMIAACRAFGLRAIDGPFGDIADQAGYADSARRAAALGAEGKWAIHPSQIPLANEVFSPPEAEVARARRIVEELRRAEAGGRGAAAVDGKMIDAASERMARLDVQVPVVVRLAGTNVAKGREIIRGSRLPIVTAGTLADAARKAVAAAHRLHLGHAAPEAADREG